VCEGEIERNDGNILISKAYGSENYHPPPFPRELYFFGSVLVSEIQTQCLRKICSKFLRMKCKSRHLDTDMSFTLRVQLVHSCDASAVFCVMTSPFVLTEQEGKTGANN
jgi:hypothetical protein